MVQPSTIESKLKSINQFVGFCVTHLNLEASMEHVMDPMLVAKFWGFLMAKGGQLSTFKKVASHLKESIPYIASHHIPITKTWSNKQVKNVTKWYTNLSAKLNAQVNLASKTKPTSLIEDITLWEIWEAVRAERDALLKEWEVSVWW